MADIGYLSLVTGLVISLYAAIAPFIAVKYNNWNLVRSAQNATVLVFAMVSIASCALLYALVTSDFSNYYVWGHSSSDLPLFYKITSFWGGMEGSLLLWAWVQSGFSMFVALYYQQSNRQLVPYVIVILNVIAVFLLFLLVGWSNPLALQAGDPMEGRGLNPLLQNPAMVVHPPSLYIGYISFSVPYAFAMAGLICGKLDNEWVVTIRRWTLFGWYFLTLGLFLGGQWAYEELGWGGYWAWDPVENAALMPWLTGTAFLHSIMIQEKRNMLRIWNVVLIITTFALTILGTFLTRSGIINSVHSFAQSEIGPAFLIFLAIMVFWSLSLLVMRLKSLEASHEIESILCKENSFLMQNVLFVGIAFTVLLGTTFPLLAEAVRGTKLSIQAPFFNTITTPMGLLLFFLMGIGTLIAWRKSSLSNLKKNFLKPVIVASVITVILAVAFAEVRVFGALIIFWIASFVATTIFIEFYKATSTKMRQMNVSAVLGFVYVILRNRRRYGGLIIHLGVVMMFIGFAGNYYGHVKDMTLTRDTPVEFQGYTLTYQGIDEYYVRNAKYRAAQIQVSQNGEVIEVMEPSKSFYPTQPNPLTEVAIRRTPLEDLYLVFVEENTSSNSVTIKAYVNPLVAWAWASLIFFTLGVGICMAYRPKGVVTQNSEKPTLATTGAS